MFTEYHFVHHEMELKNTALTMAESHKSIAQ
jgi:hypothetical protein